MEEIPISDSKGSDAIAKSNSSSPYYYWCDGEKIYLSKVSDTYFAVIEDSSNGVSANSMDASAPELHDCTGIYYESPNGSQKNYSWGKVDSVYLASNATQIVYSSPYFRTSAGDEIGLTNLFCIKLKNEGDIGLLNAFAQSNNVSIVAENYVPLWYRLSCNANSTGNAMELANQAYESGQYAATSVYFSDSFEVDSYAYNDPYFSSQWNLNGLYGIDIETVHSITSGDSTVTVAIIDNGFQTDHPDLMVTESWDATTKSSPAKLYSYPQTPNSSHGTLMAGIINARSNNGLGIVGIAPNVRIIPISVDFQSSMGAFISAFQYAIEQGADVISNSWISKSPFDDLNDVIQSALSGGRDGKGCIVAQSAGNNGSSEILYPYGSCPDIICVGNIKNTGSRYSSSNYGNQIDIVAPGTDITSTNSNSGYLLCTGTSPACPHVAATAALMLSVNPSLTRSEVEEIIERTARKLSTYNFINSSGHPNGTWNLYVGHGLVNTADAVKTAYYYNADNYLNLAEFDFTGASATLSLTAEKDIAVIWDWESKDISYFEASQDTPIDTTVTHTYVGSDTRHIIVAETYGFGETPSQSSTALTRFELVSANAAKNIQIDSVNRALEYIRLIGGSDSPVQSLAILGMKALKELYLVQMKATSLTVRDCPELVMMGTSRFTSNLYAIPPVSPAGQSLDYSLSNTATNYTVHPFVVSGSDGTSQNSWPAKPEPEVSLLNLNISNCPKLLYLSLENTAIKLFSALNLPKLRSIFLSSCEHGITGNVTVGSNPSLWGKNLALSIGTLPSRSSTDKGYIFISGVNDDFTNYERPIIHADNLESINNSVNLKNWNITWTHGVQTIQ